jgi:hypothetical protein
MALYGWMGKVGWDLYICPEKGVNNLCHFIVLCACLEERFPTAAAPSICKVLV